MKVARGGANWIVTPIAMALIMVGLSGPLSAPWLVPLSTIPCFFGLLFLGFFRDPERRVADDIASPADGKVLGVDQVDDPDLGRCDRLRIFMRVTDVHVNRFPLEADVRRVTHRPGKHLPAFSKDSDRNERVETLLATPLGDVKVVQIAGAVARRIVPYIEAGDHAAKGERLGLIRMGSRCDVIVPVGKVTWTVQAGDRVYASATTVGRAP